MSSTARPSGNLNQLGLTKADYKGATSTLCAGCGHDAISSQISRTFFEMGVNPYRVAKMSGIGCSSKTPAYFLGRSHDFNSKQGPVMSRSQRRWRYRFDRAWTVLPYAETQYSDDLRSREQWSLRPDERSVLRHIRDGCPVTKRGCE